MRSLVLTSVLIVSLIVDVIPVSAAKPDHTLDEIVDVIPVSAAKPDHSLDEALLLMVSSYDLSFEESEEVGGQLGSRGLMKTVSSSFDPAGAPANEAQRLLTMYQELCADLHGNTTADQLAVDKCVTEKVLTHVCGPAIERLKKQAEQLARQRRRRSNPLRRFFRRLDPSRINLKRFGRWLSEEVIKEAVVQMVTGGAALQGKMARRVLRQVFWKKVRREVRPEAANVTVSRDVVVQPVDFDAFVRQCQRENRQEDASNDFNDLVEEQPDSESPAESTAQEEPQPNEAGEVVRCLDITQCQTRSYYWSDILLPREASHFSYHDSTGAEDVGDIAFTLGFDEEGLLADSQMSFHLVDDVWTDDGSQQLSYVDTWVSADFSRNPLKPVDTDGATYWTYQGEVDVNFKVEGWSQCSYVADPEAQTYVFYNVETAKTETHAVPFELTIELLPIGELSDDAEFYGGSQRSDGSIEIYLNVVCTGSVPLDSSE
ncbi:MAG: hypothetical protein P8Z42_10000 [Anaerolineales bacterium]